MYFSKIDSELVHLEDWELSPIEFHNKENNTDCKIERDGSRKIARIAKSVFIELRSESRSIEAVRLLDDLIDMAWHIKARKKRPSLPFKKVANRLIGDLLQIERDNPGGYGFRGFRAADYTGEDTSFDSLNGFVTAMETLGYLDVVRGFQGSKARGTAGQQTRLRVTAAFLNHAANFRVHPSDWDIHFERLRNNREGGQLRLRAPTKRRGNLKFKGPDVSYDPTKVGVADMKRRLAEYDLFIAAQTIDPDKHNGFCRIFHQRNHTDRSLTYGGRIYSLGDSYQQLSGEKRRHITINGEPTVEIDIKASHPTILHGRLGIPLACSDPYCIPGIPRAVVKTWVTMTLGYDRFQSRWPSEAVSSYRRENGRALGKDYPITQVRAAVTQRLPGLAKWEGNKLRWGDLQYLESCVIFDTIYELATEHNIAALPVHDSIIIPASGMGISRKLLSETF